jgi:hypothetical protein
VCHGGLVTSLRSGAAWMSLSEPLGERTVRSTVHTCHLLCWFAAEEIAAGDVSLLHSQIAYVYVGNVNITLYCLVLKRETVSSLGITQI